MRKITLITTNNKKIILEDLPLEVRCSDILEIIQKNSELKKYSKNVQLISKGKILEEKDIIEGDEVIMQETQINYFLVFLYYFVNLIPILLYGKHQNLLESLTLFVVGMALFLLVKKRGYDLSPKNWKLTEIVMLFVHSMAPSFRLENLVINQ